MRRHLAVAIDDGRGYRTVTGKVRGLKFSKTAPGGHTAASFQMLAPHDLFDDLGAADPLRISKGDTGAPLWDGYAVNPNPISGKTGQSWDMTGVGAVAVASDESRVLIYADRTLDKWEPRKGLAVTASVASGSDPRETLPDGLLCQFNPGNPVGINGFAGMRYPALAAAGLQFGSLTITTQAGKVDGSYNTQLGYQGPGIPFGALGTLGAAGTISDTQISNTFWIGQNASHPPAGVDVISVNLYRTGGATNVGSGDDKVWAFFTNLCVRMRRMDRYGTLLTASAGLGPAGYVTADQVVEDLLGRVLTMCDPVTAVVEAGTFQIDQLAYFDGVKAAGVLDDLVNLYEPDQLWEILERQANGLHRAGWRYWPTTARYLLDSDVDIDEQGNDVDLCNRVLVIWTDTSGTIVTRAFGQEVPALGAGSPVNPDGTPNTGFTGRVHDADPVTLPDGKGSLANATRIAGQVLTATSGTVPPAAKATVGGRIYDRLRNLWVWPYELEPGYLARDVAKGVDLRVTAMEYDDDAFAASLDLGTPVLTLDQQLGQLPTVKAA